MMKRLLMSRNGGELEREKVKLKRANQSKFDLLLPSLCSIILLLSFPSLASRFSFEEDPPLIRKLISSIDSNVFDSLSQGVGSNDDKVLVLAATNTPYALDQAIRRRFDKRIYIPLPDLKARQHMFKVHLGDTPHSLTERDFEQLAQKTEGFSGSDISVCVNEVLFEPVRKTQDAQFFIKDSDMWIPCGPRQPGAIQTDMQELAAQGLASKILPPPIRRTDFDKVLARQKPTVSKGDLQVHEKFTKEFGEDG